jgi:hypothetical protein
MGFFSRLFGSSGNSKKDELRALLDSIFTQIEEDKPGNFTPEDIMNAFTNRLPSALKRLGSKQEILKALGELERENRNPMFPFIAEIVRAVV